MSRTILLTGGAGFIGSNFAHFSLRERPDWSIINLDAMTYSGNPRNVEGLDESRHRLVIGDICDRSLVDSLMAECDAVVHMAAESHVDRSIVDATPFVRTNVMGTQCLLDAARAQKERGRDVRFLFVSTDEVYGSLPLDEPHAKFTEDSPIDPRSPYASSKASADLLCQAYFHTYELDVVTTRCANNMGPRQYPEKVIPLFVTNLLRGEKLPVYGDGSNVRDWMHVDDHCESVISALEKGGSGEVYNIGAGNERSNLQLARDICRQMGAGEEMIEFVADRPGHDLRYAIDASKATRELGWRATRSDWDEALRETIEWYNTHQNWWQEILRGDHHAMLQRP
jgi:dTDP-glucose 4,6-dehydratase